MHENYGGNLAVKAGDGTWTHGQGGDGRFRNGVRFEPVCNCPVRAMPSHTEFALALDQC